ncbi:hypothetical protein [Cereibacter changlensis]|uniref:hypothetical protein n=1 Tax=Cereibacter changlensis TaxID=402884 RepID=UPI001B8749D3|nr:hypothetical protein [Cereibacter changlensis]
MLQIGHRESHDIDLFISDAQYLPFLNPETQGYRLEIAASDYETDGTRALKIVFDGVGEIDFICCGPVTEDPFTLSEIRGRRVRLETPAESSQRRLCSGRSTSAARHVRHRGHGQGAWLQLCHRNTVSVPVGFLRSSGRGREDGSTAVPIRRGQFARER